MMVKPSSKQPKINRADASMENHKINNLKEEPHLSGAYIRSLVKHLTSIKTKDSFTANEKPPESVSSNGDQCIIDHNNMQTEPPPQPPPPSPPVKKQVRRRRQTSKPYQERLLNMAEARREIVTALKFHRASMKQRESAGNRYPQVEESSTIVTTSNLSSNYNQDYYSSLSCSPRIPYYCPISGPLTLPPLNQENLDFTLPNQTLGLNLNFQDFINLDANLYHNPLPNYPTSSSSSSSSLSSSSSTSSSAAISLTTKEIAADTVEEMVATSTTTSTSSSSSGAMMSGDLHHAIDEEGMEEIRSLGEQHQMEWNDTVNLMTSARWFKFLKNIEIEQEDEKVGLDDEINPFSQVIEYPPCMDIGGIEGMDGKWLA